MSTMGHQGIGGLSENEKMFTGFFRNQDIVIGVTYFLHKEIHMVTWVLPLNVTRNQIDHIAINRIASDHHLLTTEILHKIAFIKLNRDKAQGKFDVSKLSDTAIGKQFRNVVRE